MFGSSSCREFVSSVITYDFPGSHKPSVDMVVISMGAVYLVNGEVGAFGFQQVKDPVPKVSVAPQNEVGIRTFKGRR